ncbi:Bud site selection protein 6 [Basidiobolus ranarum]|uniref:Bud site selection protein 6 n=1 Tax=Basidiobolus ranarum TaxID=34480 RepID=A0ABR2WTM9_9FUNG
MADDYKRYYPHPSSPPHNAPQTQPWEYTHANSTENNPAWPHQGYPQPSYPSSRHLPPYSNQPYQNYPPSVPGYPGEYDPSSYSVGNPPPSTIPEPTATIYNTVGMENPAIHRQSNLHRSQTYGHNSVIPERVNSARGMGPDQHAPLEGPHNPDFIIPKEKALPITPQHPSIHETVTEQVTPEGISIPLVPLDQKPETNIFLEFENQVKKITLSEQVTSLTMVGQLFVEKFGLTLEQVESLPLYIKDKDTLVWYELEDLKDLEEKSHLRLNVQVPSESKVDKIQQQVDNGFSMIVNEMNELKALFKLEKANTSVTPGFNGKSIQRSNTIADTGSFKNRDNSLLNSSSNNHGNNSRISPTLESSSQQEKLRQFQKEIRSLRTELIVVKQLYNEFQIETTKMLSNLASNTQTFKEKLEKTPQSSRTFIDTGINKLEQKAISVYDRMHDLQDLIDDMKALVIKNGRPSKFQMEFAFKESKAIAEELIGQRNYVDEVTPGWKKNFEEELKHIISCQEFLKKHQALLNDLEDEHKESQTLLEQLGKILELKAKTVVKPITIEVAPIEERQDVLGNVFQEIACVDPDSERRLRAMAQSEKLRRWELENKVDEFEAQLNHGSKKLRKTGGTEELERLREKRNRETLAALLQQQTSPPPSQPKQTEAEGEAPVEEPTEQTA